MSTSTTVLTEGSSDERDGSDYGALHAELQQLIASTRSRVASRVNAELTQLYWSVGQRLRSQVLGEGRASYGTQIITQLGQRLAQEFGRGFEAKNLRRMLQFAEMFPDPAIVATLSRQLNWSHFTSLFPLKNPESRAFYAHLIQRENLSVRELRARIAQKTYERTALASSQTSDSSRNGDTNLSPALSEFTDTNLLSPALVFKDPYFLEFLGLPADYDERSLESAILRDMEAFILELGRGFAFVERQKRMIIDGEDFYLDLFFYHRQLRRLVAIELKLGRFKASHKGQMELYLKWLNKYERQAHEEAPIGLILCAESSREQIELLEMHKDGIVVAEYWNELPPKKDMEQQLHNLLIAARERLAARGILAGNGAV